jgi:DNA-binding Lrp family transcriptional regulator
MKRVQLEALSESLSKAINPATRKREATSLILDQIEPLPIIQRTSEAQTEIQTSPQLETLDTGIKSTPVSVNTVSNLTPVSNSKGYAAAKNSGYLKLANEILDSILPYLDPSEAVIFLRLYRLSAGFNQTCCTVGIAALMRACNVSESTCRRALRRLTDIGLVRQLQVVNTRELKGTTYQIDTGVKTGPNKDSDDDFIHDNHHQNAKLPDDDSSHFQEIRALYGRITGNSWLESDTQAYREHRICQIPLGTVKAVMVAVKERSGSRINSFNYFVKEILGTNDPMNRQQQKRALARIVKRVRELRVGANDSIVDFVDNVKRACTREGVVFDNDLFNSLNT